MTAPSRLARLGRQLAAFGFNIGAPIAVYYVLHGFGVANVVALSVGAIFPALGAAYTLATKRRPDGVALFVLATIVASIAVSVTAHDPRFLLAKEGLITGVWGIWFVASARTRRPAAFVFARPLLEVFAVRDVEALWQTSPGFRRIWRVSSMMWGTGLLADAAVRVVMSYTLPVHVVPGLGGALWPVTFIVLQIVTNVYYHHAGLNRLLGAGPQGSASGRAAVASSQPAGRSRP